MRVLSVGSGGSSGSRRNRATSDAADSVEEGEAHELKGTGSTVTPGRSSTGPAPPGAPVQRHAVPNRQTRERVTLSRRKLD